MREKALLAGFAAEAQTPMMMGDKTEPSPTFYATVCFDAHRCTSNFARLRKFRQEGPQRRGLSSGRPIEEARGMHPEDSKRAAR
jgi:hypothetical protein